MIRWAWPFVSVQLLLGCLLAAAWPPPKSAMAAWLIFAGLLLGGALALHSAYTAPEADPAQPKRPRYLALLGFLLLALSLLFAATFLRITPGGRYYFEIVMTCVLLSVLHSIPPIRLQARGGWDLLNKCLGFGFFIPLAGWCATGRGLEPVVVDTCIGFFFLFGVLYALLQIHQGGPTQAHKLGVGRGLTYALGGALVAHLYFLQAILKHHRQLVNAGFVETLDRGCIVLQLPQGGPSPALLLISLLAWFGVLIPWRLGHQRWTSGQAKAGLVRGLLAFGITDLSLLLLLWPKR